MTQTTENKRMTKRDMFNQAIAMANGQPTTVTPEQMVEFFNHEIALLDRKSSNPSKPTKTQVENETLKQAILRTLAETGRPMTISELIAECAEIHFLANQRVSALLTQLKTAGQVVRTEIKKKAYFSIVNTVEEEG